MSHRQTNQVTIGLLLAALSARAPAPTVQPQVTPSASPTAAPTTAAATPTPVATATTAPQAAVAGTVYDVAGAPLAGASVTVRSLEAAAPFERTVAAPDGRFLVAGLPSGTNVEVIASKPGYGARRRVGAFAVSTTPGTLDFGAPPAVVGTASRYFLSDRPEASLVEPTPDGLLADPNGFRLVVALSSPLDAENQRRFSQALRLLPADELAQGGKSGAVSLAERDDREYPLERDLRGLGLYQIKAGTTFRADAPSVAGVEWNEAGTRATFVFPAPPLASRLGTAKYQLALSAGSAPIVDINGRQLGTAPAGGFSGYPKEGYLVPGVFAGTDPHERTIPGLTAGTPEARWAATHDDAARFRVASDNKAPRLASVEVTTVDLDTRLILAFDEPLVAFDDTTTGRVGAGLAPVAASLGNFTFAVAAKRNELAGLVLDGKGPEELDPRATAAFGLVGDRRRETRFAAAAFVPSLAAAPKGSLHLSLDPKDPRRVFLTVVGRPRYLDPELTEIAVRVANVGDPAGNVIDADAANATVYRTSL